MATTKTKFTPEEYEKNMRIRFWGVIKEVDSSEKGNFRQNLVDSKNEIIDEIRDSADDSKVDTDKFDELIKINSSKSVSAKLHDTKTLSEEVVKFDLNGKDIVWKQLKLYELIVEESFGYLKGEARTSSRKEGKEQFIEMIFGLQQDFLIRALELKDEVLEKEREASGTVVASAVSGAQTESSLAGGLIWPFKSAFQITSCYGDRTCENCSQVHEGTDIAASEGTDVRSIANGKVKKVGTGYNSIEIDHGDGMSSRYLHNSEILVKEGEEVVQGKAIARSGGKGPKSKSQYPYHLHFEIIVDGKTKDPLTFYELGELGIRFLETANCFYNVDTNGYAYAGYIKSNVV